MPFYLMYAAQDKRTDYAIPARSRGPRIEAGKLPAEEMLRVDGRPGQDTPRVRLREMI